MDDLTSTTGAVALAAVVVALAALILGVAVLIHLRRIRADQQLVLGDDASADVVTHAADLARKFRALHDEVQSTTVRLTSRLDTMQTHLNGAITHTSLVRYDAYHEMSGRQSTTLALLDARRDGIVVSTIHHRDTARMYVKRVVDGAGEVQLSPEEDEAIALALAAKAPRSDRAAEDPEAP